MALFTISSPNVTRARSEFHYPLLRMHGLAVLRWIEYTTGQRLQIEEGALYPALHRMEQERWIVSEWGVSENNRRARFYKLTRAGRKLLETEKHDWEQKAAIIARFFEVKAEDLA